MAVKVRYIDRIGSSYRYRRVVPPALRANLGGQRNWLTFWPSRIPEEEVIAAANRLARKHDTFIARAKTGEVVDAKLIAEVEAQARTFTPTERVKLLANMDAVEAFPGQDVLAGETGGRLAVLVNALQHNNVYTPEHISLQTAYDRNIEALQGKGKSRDEKPYAYAVRSFIKIVGDKDIRAITPDDVRQWERAAIKSKLMPSTITRRASPLKTILKEAFRDLRYSGFHPFDGFRIEGGGGSSEDRLSFHKRHLALIDAYLAATPRLGADTRNLLTLMRFTGTGPAEIGGIAVSDVQLEGDAPFVWLRPNAIRKRLKNKFRARRIPLVAGALHAMKDAVKRAKSRVGAGDPETTAVFTGFKAKTGASSISAKLNNAIRAAGVPEAP